MNQPEPWQPPLAEPPLPPSTPPSFRTRPLLPPEIILTILEQLGITNRALIIKAARISKQWHAVAFPFIHRTLTLTEWTPQSANELKHRFRFSFSNIASIVHFLVSKADMPNEQEWIDDEVARWKSEVVGESDEEEDDFEESPWFIGVQANQFALQSLAKQKDISWIKNRRSSEREFWGMLVDHLPALKEIELREFRFPLGVYSLENGLENEASQSWERFTWNRESDETRIQRRSVLSKIQRITLVNCGQAVEDTVRNHWRLSDVVVVKVENTQ